ncbi:MAG TPA: hypothetical protein VLL76_04580 [Candidatus Omnitrophota bacterium]|nr:hypothetical protein [Candidatus Omnitrophota bacterium]
MGLPQRTTGPLESLDRILHRLIDMVTGEHEHEHAETVEEAIRRIEDRLPPPTPPGGEAGA